MNEEIFKISKDKARAKDLLIISKERLDIIKILPADKPYKIIEEYYEIIIELITAIMYVDGYKTLSHISAIDYLSKNYNILSEYQIKIIDTLRKFRNGIVYYGKKISKEYLINNEEVIKDMIGLLSNLVEKRLNNSK